MHIQFIRNYRAYSPGDVAGFDPSVAEVLIQKRIAVLKQWDEASAPQVDAADARGQAAADEGNASVGPEDQTDPADSDEDAKTKTQEKARGRRR